MSIYEIITQGQKDGKTLAEINADLAAAGYQTAFGDKDGNAFLDSGVGEPEPCSVEGGKADLLQGRAPSGHRSVRRRAVSCGR